MKLGKIPFLESRYNVYIYFNFTSTCRVRQRKVQSIFLNDDERGKSLITPMMLVFLCLYYAHLMCASVCSLTFMSVSSPISVVSV